ncbi:MAG: GDYXXLXY domain-containing protein [Bacteroidota bacterium]|nr:GDYXXLXY domain-containing protein [Bacteroidota bacterium]
MNNKKTILTVFILVALAQIYVPAKMILEREDILKTGKEFKFKTTPIDPSDPFRGKYITLRFDENSIEVNQEEKWERDEPVYLILTTDMEGFVKLQSVKKQKPDDNQDFLKTKVNYLYQKNDSTKISELSFDYPFDRFYMEESKAYEAELTYNESIRDTAKVTYALVNIKEGDAVLKDVVINGIPIKKIVKARRKE